MSQRQVSDRNEAVNDARRQRRRTAPGARRSVIDTARAICQGLEVPTDITDFILFASVHEGDGDNLQRRRRRRRASIHEGDGDNLQGDEELRALACDKRLSRRQAFCLLDLCMADGKCLGLAHPTVPPGEYPAARVCPRK